jgi:AraC-like DNA-binding protein
VLGDLDNDAPSVRELARQAGISTFHFIRQFEALFGVTPRQYRIQARLDRAKHLLSEGELSVTDVCFAVGMSSLGSFSKLFAARFGLSPTEYKVQSRHRITACMDLMAAAYSTSLKS